ncbi:MAG: hypothetical protein U0457_04715 [Candidatus Sericytochromatia bacterium]
MEQEHYYEKTAMLKSEFLETVSKMFENDFGKPVGISEFHTLKQGDGNNLFYVVTDEGYKFLVDLTGVSKNSELIYWIENIDFSGKIANIFYTQDQIIIIFSRGEKYNNEYIVYFYVYGNKYPAIRFLANEVYPNYVKMLSNRYKKHEIKYIPKELYIN